MGDKSKIEWTDASWTPIRARDLKSGKVGWHCEHATTGCEFCYAEGMNHRLGTGLPFKPGHRKDIEIFLDEEMLLAPLRWKKPRMIFVCSMTDLFAEFVKDEWIDKIFATMMLSQRHTFQVLTKRADRMKNYINRWFMRLAESDQIFPHPAGPTKIHALFDWAVMPTVAPNIWIGVSCERQQEAEQRVPLLLQTPAAVRFISAEPLMGAIDLTRVTAPWNDNPPIGDQYADWGISPMIERLDWVIVGGESGKNARPMHPDWPRALRDQCAAADVPFFFKQWGEWQQTEEPASETQEDEELRDLSTFFDGAYMRRVGKKKAGRLLDGVEYNGMPRTQ